MSMSAYDETHLPATTRVGARRSYSRMSWGSVLAGAAVAGASMILLSLLGVAIGAGGLRFTQTTASDMAGYGLGAGIWTAINLILSMAFGAYVAARLSGTHSHLDAELHGITVWAVATLLMTMLLAQAAGSILGTVASTAGSAASTAATSAGSLAGGVAQGVVQQVSPQSLVDQLDQSLTASNDPTQMTHAQIASEITVLAGRRVVNGSLTDQERDRLSALVAAQAGISKDEAARRVARMEQNATAALAQAEQQAAKAAETAAHGAAVGAKAIFSSLLLSLAGALGGAWLGTRHARVLTPIHEPEYDTHTTTYVTHHTYESPTTVHHTTDQVTTATPATVRVYDEPAGAVPAYLRGVSFPATKQDLLRAARAAIDDPAAVRRIEQVADRSYSSLNDLMSALLATA
jgi:Protein of unknown function (DUF2795)